MNKRDVIEILKSGKEPVITVFGDYCLDKYLYIDGLRDEASLETGLTAYQIDQIKLYAGAAGTITNNLCQMGAKIYCIGILGDDGEGYDLEKSLKSVGANTNYMVHTNMRNTCTYIKPIRCEDGNEIEINRLDIKNFTKTPMALQEDLISNLQKTVEFSDAVIVCDQFEEEDLAVVTCHIREALARIANLNHKVLFYTDSRRYIDKFQNSIVKCNEKEIAKLFDANPEDVDSDKALEFASILYKKNNKPVYVTLGEYGSVVYDGSPHKIPSFPVERPIDIVGAGDAFNAGAVFALTKGASYEEAALVGNGASSIVIKQLKVTGTAKVSDIITILEKK